jgi:hypothetical protein
MNNEDKEELSSEKIKVLNTLPKSDFKTVKIVISEDIYRKLKSFGILVGFEGKEPEVIGNTIAKLYDMSKEAIYKDFVEK